jgi:hypothetical protein
MFDLQLEPEQNMSSMGVKLKNIIRKLPPEKVTLAEIIDIFGQDGLLLLCIFLTIVFLIPVSIPGMSTVFGTAILLIGICRFLNRSLWLPKRFNERQFPTEKLRENLNRGLVWFTRIQHLCRPNRLEFLTRSSFMNTVNECALITGALLLMAPFGLIPFTNTLPALTLLLLALGLLQRDGLCILFGHLTNITTIVYFMLIITGGGAVFYKIIQ